MRFATSRTASSRALASIFARSRRRRSLRQNPADRSMVRGRNGDWWGVVGSGCVRDACSSPAFGGTPTVRLAFRSGRRDPYWDLDGRAARKERRHRRLVASTVVVLAVAILALVMLRLGSRDTTTFLSGPQSAVIVTSLAADTVACCLIFASASRRRTSLRRYDEVA